MDWTEASMQADAEAQAEYDRKPPTRVRLLYHGAKLTDGERNKQYGEPVGNMQDIAHMWNAYMDGLRRAGWNNKLCAEDVAHMLTLMKVSRTFSGVTHPDNYVDAAVYQAIAGECADHAEGNDGDN